MAGVEGDGLAALLAAAVAEDDGILIYDRSTDSVKVITPDNLTAAIALLSLLPSTAVSVDSTLIAGTSTLLQTVLEEIDGSVVAHVGDSTNAHAATAIGADDTGLGVDFTTVQGALAALDAASQATGIPATTVDAKGDILVATADNTVTKFTAGANNTIIVYDSAQTPGIKAMPPRAIPALQNDQSVDYSLVLADAGKVVRQTGASKTITLPRDADIDFDNGTEGVIVSANGPVTIAPGSGVSIVPPPFTTLVMVGTGSQITWRKKADNVYEIQGDLVVRPRTLIPLEVFGPAVNNATGDSAVYFPVPPELAGFDIVACYAHTATASSSGAITVQVHRRRSAANVDVFSTAVTIDANEIDTATAATPAVVNTSNDDLATGDELHIDVDGIGTGSKGLVVTLVAQ